MHLKTILQMARYYNHYYEKITEAIKLKCGFDFDYIIKYIWQSWQLQLKVSNIDHVINIFITRCMSPMYCVNLDETSHTHRSTINTILKNSIV